MPPQSASLTELGWTPFFSAQISAQDQAGLMPVGVMPVRVMAVHRGMLAVAGAGGERMIPSTIPRATVLAGGEEAHATVGDWLLFDEAKAQIARVLSRASVFKRSTPGNVRKTQLIAANVDTLFIVASCNQDFNLARLERYLVLAGETGVTPVIVLTKADRTETPEIYAEPARALGAELSVEVVNAKDPRSVARLADWCGMGKTVALVGSSGVGKSTLIKTLTNKADIATQAVREADGKGRHTTTVREMHRLASGGWLIDTPGMRELHLAESEDGLAEVFDDIVMLAQQCRFSNCSHGNEPDCAIREELAAGRLEPIRYERWRKLIAEEAVKAAPGRSKRR